MNSLSTLILYSLFFLDQSFINFLERASSRLLIFSIFFFYIFCIRGNKIQATRQICLATYFIIKVVLKQNYAHLFIYYLQLLLHYNHHVLDLSYFYFSRFFKVETQSIDLRVFFLLQSQHYKFSSKHCCTCITHILMYCFHFYLIK